MDIESLLPLIGTLLFLLIFSAFSSGAETGIMASNKVKLRNMSKNLKGAKRALKLLQRPDILLSSILIGNNFANILASAIVTSLMLKFFGGGILVGSIILTLVILIFSEITPKTIASVHPEHYAIKASWLLKVLVFIFRPLVWVTNIVSSRILKIARVNPMAASTNDDLNSDELRTLLAEHGDLIPLRSRQMLSSVLGMEELTVEDIMTPHAEIVGIDIKLGIDNAKKIIASSDFSQLPVFRDSIDSVIGMLHLKNSHQFIQAFESNQDFKNSLSDAFFVSQSTTLTTQLNQFQKQGNKIGLIVDEYGDIQGILTMEGIFTEIVGKFGEAKAELDREFIQKKDGSIIVDGNSRVRDLNNHVGWNLNEDGSKTINGVIVDFLDQIPQANLCLELEDYRIEILSVEENFVSKVKINKKGS